MPRYSYQCEECDEEKTITCDRGKAPKELECECGGKMKRLISIGDATNISSKEPPSKAKKLKENLRKREKKINELDPSERDRFRKWSRRQTGGRW